MHINILQNRLKINKLRFLPFIFFKKSAIHLKERLKVTPVARQVDIVVSAARGTIHQYVEVTKQRTETSVHYVQPLVKTTPSILPAGESVRVTSPVGVNITSGGIRGF